MNREDQRTRLEVKDVSLSFGGLAALSEVSFDVKDGEILALIGPNGAGKTALINSITGYYRPAGEIRFDGEKINGLPPAKVAHRGIARTFQNLALFTGMSTLANVMAGRHLFFKGHILGTFVNFGPAHAEEIRQRRIAEDIIDFLEIEAVRHKVVGSLPYGMRKRVELGRALAQEPQLLLLDEPMAGMSMDEKEDIARFIIDIWEEKRIPIILVEHDMGVVMDIAQWCVVLDFGRKVYEGPPRDVKSNPEVIRAYLGQE